VSTPLDAIESPNAPAGLTLSRKQYQRLNIYRSLIRLARLTGGSVDVLSVDSRPVAVSCWLPPHNRPSLLLLWRSGLLGSIFHLGIISAYRLLFFKSMVDRLYTSGLQGLSITQSDGAYVEILGTDPTHSGHGYGAKLLQWQIIRHQHMSPDAPVFLDTNSDYAQKIYEELGFIEINRKRLPRARIDRNGCDVGTIRLGMESQVPCDTHAFRILMLRCAVDCDQAGR